MSQFLRKALHFRYSSLVSVQNPNVGSLRWFSISSEDDRKHSFTVSYLMNSLEFSPKTALSCSKNVSFDSFEKPDNVIEFFTNFGFTKTQISSLVIRLPQVLVSSTEKTISPKLEFFKSKGFSVPEMAKMLTSSPKILKASLANQIIPSYSYLSDMFQSDESVVCAVKRCPDILGYKLKKVVSNIHILREFGVPESKIAYSIKSRPLSFVFCPDRLRKVAEDLLEMGFDVSTTQFAIATHVSMGISEAKWQSKVDMYTKFGLSEEEVSKAFRRDPYFMSHSQDKVLMCMDFFVSDMNWRPSLIATYPRVLGLSLKKRIIPRCSVYKALISNGLVRKDSKVNLGTLLMASEDVFLKKYVEFYAKEAPRLLKSYKEKVAL